MEKIHENMNFLCFGVNFNMKTLKHAPITL